MPWEKYKQFAEVKTKISDVWLVHFKSNKNYSSVILRFRPQSNHSVFDSF